MNETTRWNPYAVIKSYWGEDLTPELAERIAEAPSEHLIDFSKFCASEAELPGIGFVPELPVGHIRPVVSGRSARISQSAKSVASHETLIRTALTVLLYAHEIVVDDPLAALTHAESSVRRTVVAYLLGIKSLFNEGAVHFAPTTSLKLHPVSLRKALAIEIAQKGDPYVEAWIQRGSQESKTVDDGEYARAVGQLCIDAFEHETYIRCWPNESIASFNARPSKPCSGWLAPTIEAPSVPQTC
ncbi:hypothetical protein [Paractinoplanes atraurantiacus]|uniref:Uncharacterized protein n=1 Tax=Paractinoplanes atraurantiacus TaxID=1036182 RepID=A0A285KCI1_9ACTN|nr:hypothetical protein [Actinoplanes atraurantiacus]SNY70310.1 hypothetical protein SAMN05421748_13759 [Actinoplanes atraurantiacus]